MSNPLISVIIPTFNRSYIVAEAINSVLSQTIPANEIIVIDDGSTDETSEVLASFGDKIIVIKQENKGVSAARNAGIDRARGDWIAFLDSDDIWLPNRIAVLRQDIAGTDAGVHIANLEVTGLSYKYELFKLRNFRETGPLPVRFEDGFELIFLELTFLSGIAARREWVLRAGSFDVTFPFCEDIDLLYRMIFLGPWLANGIIVGKLRRVGSTSDSLSFQYHTNRILAASIRIKIYERLLGVFQPNSEQWLLVRRMISRCWFNAARTLNMNGQRVDARATLLRSAREHPTMKGWLRAIPPLLAGTSGYKLLELIETPGFFRDELI
jgi:glycosyltransferase involved in cell wall biosynthesis